MGVRGFAVEGRGMGAVLLVRRRAYVTRDARVVLLHPRILRKV